MTLHQWAEQVFDFSTVLFFSAPVVAFIAFILFAITGWKFFAYLLPFAFLVFLLSAVFGCFSVLLNILSGGK